MLTTEIWVFVYPEVGDPPISMVIRTVFLLGPPISLTSHHRKKKSALGFHLLLGKQVKSEKLA